MKRLFFLLSLTLVFFFSCTERENTLKVQPAFLDSNGVTLNEANEIAKMFIPAEGINSERRNFRGSGAGWDVKPYLAKNNETAFYIVNYENKEGFFLLSADKRTDPILAFGTEDNFTLDVSKLPEGLEYWISATAEMISENKINNRKENSNGWDIEVMAKILGRLVDQSLVNLRSEPIEDDPCTEEWYTKNSLGTATWNQGNGYNDDDYGIIPDYGCASPSNGHAWTGCVATAMAEIMKYKSKPSSFSWSVMPNTNSPNSYIANLMADIGSNVSMNYGCSGSSAYMFRALSAFKNDYGYSNAKRASVIWSTVAAQIESNKPVVIAGGSHAWVCDGYKTYKDTICNTHMYGWMNWGWGGSYNAWYGIGSLNPPGHDYNTGVEMIYDLN